MNFNRFIDCLDVQNYRETDDIGLYRTWSAHSSKGWVPGVSKYSPFHLGHDFVSNGLTFKFDFKSVNIDKATFLVFPQEPLKFNGREFENIFFILRHVKLVDDVYYMTNDGYRLHYHLEIMSPVNSFVFNRWSKNYLQGDNRRETFLYQAIKQKAEDIYDSTSRNFHDFTKSIYNEVIKRLNNWRIELIFDDDSFVEKCFYRQHWLNPFQYRQCKITDDSLIFKSQDAYTCLFYHNLYSSPVLE